MIRRFSHYLDTHPLEAVALGAAVAFVIMVIQRSF